MKSTPLICPQCKGHLMRDGDQLICEQCKEKYSISAGIPDFIGSFEYWGEIDQERMKKALEIARKESYLSALSEGLIGEHVPLHYFYSSARMDWIFHCLNLKRTNACLDVGSGLGTLSFLLTNLFKEVWSVEPVWERLWFQEIVKNQEKLDGLKLVRGFAHKLPFEDNYFDLVVANGVLEWVAYGDFNKDPMELQLNFLREAHRILRDDGCLYIGIENRISAKNFIGERDHSGLPFTSLLPRQLANAVVSFTPAAYQKRLHGKRVAGYRTYTYSLFGYLKLLRKAGFSDVDFYWTSNYNYPRFSARIKDAHSFNSFLKNNVSPHPLKKVYLSLPQVFQRLTLELLCPHFLIYAYKQRKDRVFETQLLDKLSAQDSSYLRASGSDYSDANILYLLMKKGSDEPEYVVKFPRFRQGSNSLDLKEERLSNFNNLSYQKTSVENMPVYIEKKIPGDFMRVFDLRHNVLAINWLTDFQSKTQKGFFSNDDLDLELSALCNYVDSTTMLAKLRVEVKRDLESMFSSQKERKLNKSSEHGDYCAQNIIINGEDIFVIDWEDFKEAGNPLFDFGFFLVMNASYTGSHREPERAYALYKNFVGDGPYSRILEEIMKTFRLTKNLADEIISQLVPYTLVQYMQRHDPRFGRWRQNFTFFNTLLKTWYEKKKDMVRFLEQV